VRVAFRVYPKGLSPALGEWRGEAAVSWRCALWVVSAVVLGGGIWGGVSISSSFGLSRERVCGGVARGWGIGMVLGIGSALARSGEEL